MRDILLYFAVKYHGDFFQILQAVKTKEKYDEEELKEYKKNMKSSFITILDDSYPECLKNIHCPPIVLFYRGDISLLKSKKKVAIVGSREASPYGLKMTKKLTSEFVEKDYCIISGLARGVDSEAHKTALDKKGKTIAFVANGVDYYYPRENDDLYERIVANGGLVISEYPDGLEPAPNKFSFRNRLISGLSNFVVVTEAYDRSGTMLTVKNALYQGKDVYCVPYRALEKSICNSFIKQGAFMIERFEDVYERL